MPKTILLIQADPADAGHVREALLGPGDKPFLVDQVGTFAEGLAHLERDGNQTGAAAGDVAAVLVDLSLPDASGMEAFDQLTRAAPQLPFLVLCAPEDEEIGKQAVQHGAQDYLLKDRLDSYLLPKTVRSMIERAAIAEALFDEKERAQVTLNSIGDAVMSIDTLGRVTYLNTVAEVLTGWSRAEASGRLLSDVFQILDGATRAPAPDPMAEAIRENRTVLLGPNSLLVRRDGVEAAIEDSAAPIHDRRGRVTGAVMVFHDVTTSRALSLRMSYLAQHDSLTDLPNRVLFNDRLVQSIALAQRNRHRLAVLYLDLDKFKHINDSLGHEIGDRLLQSVAHRILKCLRGSDTVSRQGGDEFVVLLSNLAHGRDAALTADKILLALAKPHQIGEHTLQLTVSIGIATYPEDGADLDTLLKNADFAMYHAKESGRNDYQFFKANMNAGAVERQALEIGLHKAIERKEFVLHYQPKLDLETGAISGTEALIRWRHPQRGMLLPVQFMPTAEEYGFIVPIGRWVLHEACRQAREWLDAGLPPLPIAINISAVELRDRGFVDSVRATLAETGIDPGQVELELTETFLMQDGSSTVSVLRALKETGVRLALDDFGTGYSSLSHLKRFPIDTLKIDRSFVRDLATNSDDASIVRAVINMGKSLHLRVVAEGVETRAQLAFLQQQSCPEGQGYFFSQPMAPDPFVASLRRQSHSFHARPVA
jgi:diguanylate cyclase (GGDEF)-like protein/PAS domain S-box-containing protein